jgi:hypothetical protein
MTQTIVLGEQKDKAFKKPIEFLTHINILTCDDVSAQPVDNEPCDWNYIELICKDYRPNLDLMFAYDNASDRSEGVVIIGRWNDGVVK